MSQPARHLSPGSPPPPTLKRLFVRPIPQREWRGLDSQAEVFELLDDRHAPRTPAGSRAAALAVRHLPTRRGAWYVLLLHDGRLLLERLRPAAAPLSGCFICHKSGQREYVPAAAIRTAWRLLYWCFCPAEDDERPTPPRGQVWPYSHN